ncbi:MAG: ribosomal protein S18-alanine N-acetyltransferase [Candidatus Thermoplasmatota archaeon]|jgi:ribosomal-protein-alanine N-acetyltransferase|nr:ribosomal protein S18-alanine N-acetyltransferase [Candidatus Thermoplasmatota archaeon]MCL5791104.1 ribosomal protein S18-alanine N-acetyltransferase [Candidatus Thermoplasmatota archaeon]
MKKRSSDKVIINRKPYSSVRMPEDGFNPPVVRRFQLDDLRRVMQISTRSLSEKYSEDLMVEIFQSWPDGFLVSEQDNQINGFLAGRKMSRSEARILMLAVEENLRNMGIGGILLEKFIDISRIYGIIVLRLEVRTDNRKGIEFYQKHGFLVTSILRNYYSDGSDAYIMWRQLI